MNQVIFSYTKPRHSFGKQPMFCESPTVILDSIEPNKQHAKMYGLRNPVHRESQADLPKSEHYVNTYTVEYESKGINHAEGGWPKEIHYADEEATQRYCRRIERDLPYINAVQDAAPMLHKCIFQNNAVDMYEKYFSGLDSISVTEKPKVMLRNVYRDEERKRPISSIDWTREDDPKIVVAYCDKKYPVNETVNKDFTCFMWHIDQNKPILELITPVPCWQIVCSPVAPDIMVGGLEDGTVCIFDIREQAAPVLETQILKSEVTAVSEHYVAHRAPVSALVYIEGRMNNEFFCGSSDGKCMWYDIRNISKPLDFLIMNLSGKVNMENAEGVSSLHFERAFPTRFLCGTETGFVVNVNRKGKSYTEIMSGIFKAHDGPVKSLHRSPSIPKYFITCGDWKVNIWADDTKTDPIIVGTAQRYQIQDVSWAPHRVSSYMTVTSGKFYYWDLLRSFEKPIFSLKLSNSPLLKLKPHRKGELVVIGNSDGNIYLLSLSENLVLTGGTEKPMLTQMLERETRREHILEARVKEIRLKQMTMGEELPAEDKIDEVDLLKKVEDEYRKIVLKEIRSRD